MQSCGMIYNYAVNSYLCMNLQRTVNIEKYLNLAIIHKLKSLLLKLKLVFTWKQQSPNYLATLPCHYFVFRCINHLIDCMKPNSAVVWPAISPPSTGVSNMDITTTPVTKLSVKVSALFLFNGDVFNKTARWANRKRLCSGNYLALVILVNN